MAWAQAIGAGLQLYGASQQRKAQRKAAQAMEQAAAQDMAARQGMAEPYTQAATPAFAQLRRLLGMQAGQVGEDNPFLRAQHEQNTTNINRGYGRAKAESAFLARTSPSAGRGLSLRADRSRTDALNSENTGYGMGQLAYRQNAEDRLARTMGTAFDLGSQGNAIKLGGLDRMLQARTGAAGARADAATGMWNNIAGIAGDVVGGIEARKSAKDNQAFLTGLFGKPKQQDTGGGQSPWLGPVAEDVRQPDITDMMGGDYEYDAITGQFRPKQKFQLIRE